MSDNHLGHRPRRGRCSWSCTVEGDIHGDTRPASRCWAIRRPTCLCERRRTRFVACRERRAAIGTSSPQSRDQVAPPRKTARSTPGTPPGVIARPESQRRTTLCPAAHRAPSACRSRVQRSQAFAVDGSTGQVVRVFGDTRRAPLHPASEPETSEAPGLCAQRDSRRAWLDAIHVPRRRSLRRCVERGGDAGAALVGLRRPTVVRPRLRNARHDARIGHPRRVTLDDYVRVADRHGDRAARIARDVAALPGARARLEPERAIEPEGADRSHMRAAILVYRRQPGRSPTRARGRSRTSRRPNPPAPAGGGR